MKGCLVVHGLTGTPETVEVMSQSLMDNGFHVIAPRLAGHGGTMEELAASTWRDWYETVRIAYAELRRQVEKVYYTGISLGALLGLKLALDEGWGIRALALMATPLQLSFHNRLLIPLVRNTPLRFVVTSVPKNAAESVADPEGRRRYMEMTLQRIPAKATFELADLQRRVREQLPKISNPLLLIHAKNDHVSPYSNVELIKKSVSSEIVETATFSRSRHVITMDLEKELAAHAAVQFFKRFD